MLAPPASARAMPGATLLRRRLCRATKSSACRGASMLVHKGDTDPHRVGMLVWAALLCATSPRAHAPTAHPR